jgi:predicted amidohydrolase
MTPFRVACCQVRAFDIEDAEANLQNILRSLDEAGAAGADLALVPESSYPAYYLRDANPYARPGVRPFGEVRDLFAAKARQHGYWLAAGLAVPHENGALANSGMVFNPQGETVGRYDKSFLWHFDSNWFERGSEFPVFDMGFARCGILICADGRMPEIARCLALNGAEVILDLTAWVAWARTTAGLDNPQREYMMPVRALENGAWVVAADKWGQEAGTIGYAGRSCVIDPAGVMRACAPPDQEAVLVYDIEPRQGEIVARRPALYHRLVEPTESLPIARLLHEPLVPAAESHRLAVIPGDGTFDSGRLVGRFAELRRQGADVVVAAGSSGPEGWQVDLPMIETAVCELGGTLVFGVRTNGCSATEYAVLVTPERTFEHQATHGRGILTGELPAPVIETAAGNVGIVCGDEGLVPEVARALMLEGADILAWPLFGPTGMTEAVVRTRADENRVYVAAAWEGGGLVAAPSGQLLTAVPAGTGTAMTAPMSRMLSRSKEMAPATNVVLDRIPEAYEALVAPVR